MHRITITLDDALMQQLDAFIAAGSYHNRSEEIRDLARAGLLQHEAAPAPSDCVAALVHVYDHDARQLPRRLTGTFHDHHAMTVSTIACAPGPQGVHGDRGPPRPTRRRRQPSNHSRIP